MIIPNIWDNKKCSKPPTSYGKTLWCHHGLENHRKRIGKNRDFMGFDGIYPPIIMAMENGLELGKAIISMVHFPAKPCLITAGYIYIDWWDLVGAFNPAN